MHDYGIVGEIGGPFSSESFEWKIPSFFSMTEVDSFCQSPDLDFMNSRFFLRICSNGQATDGSRGCTSLYLWKLHRRSLTKTVHFTLGIKRANCPKEEIVRGKILKVQCVVFVQFLQRSDILARKSELAPLDTLTITCSLWSDEPFPLTANLLASRETQTDDLSESSTKQENKHLNTEGTSLLLKNFKDLLLSGQDHDVTLKVKDQEFRAHKNILRARSPVFAAMFTHNLTETESGSVSIDDCDPETFGEFLKYIYAGSVEGMSPRIALGLYYAGDKYEFLDLKETCVEYLKAYTTTTVISDVIALATVHGENELLNCATAFFAKHLEEILMSVEWQRFLAINPTQGNELYIKAMKILLHNK